MSNLNNIENEYQYYQEIKSSIKDMIQDNLSYSDTNNWDDFKEYITDNSIIEQLCDNFNIYYHDHTLITQFSHNTDAYMDVLGEDGLKGSWLEVKGQVAYWACYQDLYEAFNNIDAENHYNTLTEGETDE